MPWQGNVTHKSLWGNACTLQQPKQTGLGIPQLVLKRTAFNNMSHVRVIMCSSGSLRAP